MGQWVIVALLLLGIMQGYTQITIDGNPNEWTGTAPTTDNSWAYSAGTAGGLNEWIWKDTAGDNRTDNFGSTVDPSKQDLLELRISSDSQYLYYLAKFPAGVDNTPGNGALQIQISIRRNNSTATEEWLGGIAETKVPTNTIPGGTIPDARWDYLILTRAGSNNNNHIIWTTGFSSNSYQGDVVYNATDGIYEGRIPWSAIGGQPSGQPIVFTFSLYRSDTNDDTYDISGANTKGDCLDYVTTTSGNTYDALIGFTNNQTNDAAYLDYAFEMQFSGDQTLPVQLQSFSAIVSDGAIRLQWITESEINNAAFILERSNDNEYFTKISEIPGSGNSNTRKKYAFTDKQVVKGNRYYYRLSDRDYTGSVTVLKTIRVDYFYKDNLSTDEKLPDNFQLFPAYPNPFNPQTLIRWAVPSKSQESIPVKIAVYNLTGSQLKVLLNKTLSAGIYQLHWDGTDQQGNLLPSGIYFVRMEAGAFHQTIKVIKIE